MAPSPIEARDGRDCDRRHAEGGEEHANVARTVTMAWTRARKAIATEKELLHPPLRTNAHIQNNNECEETNGIA